MVFLCPKCSEEELDHNGYCSFCGYSLKTPCKFCGFYNFANAKFCGDCGRGTTFYNRITQSFNRKVDFLQKLKLKKFAAGMCFGALLVFFAFFSTGMYSDYNIGYMSSQELIENQTSGSTLVFYGSNELRKWYSAKNANSFTNLKELETVLEILLKYLTPISKQVRSSKKIADSKEKYLEKLATFAKSSSINRANATVVFFDLLADFLAFSYEDIVEEKIYSDIPEYDVLAVPLTVFKDLKIEISRNEQTFGAEDLLTNENLKNITRAILSIAELRLKEEVFATLPPFESDKLDRSKVLN